MLQALRRTMARRMAMDFEKQRVDDIPGHCYGRKRRFCQVVGTTPKDNVHLFFIKERMVNLVYTRAKGVGWDYKGQPVDVNTVTKNERLKAVVDCLPKRVEGGYYAHFLRHAGHLKNLTEAKRLHEHILRSGRKREEFLGHLIVKMYLDCGSMENAKAVFYRMPHLDTVIWRYMVTVCAKQGEDAEVFKLHKCMQQAGIIQEKRVLLTILFVCAKMGDLEYAKQIHADIFERGLDSDILVENALISVYSRCGRLDIACLVFDMIPVRNISSWNAMIGAYVRHGFYEEAFSLFHKMTVDGFVANKVSYAAVLNACVSPAYLKEGKLIHDCIRVCGLETNVVAGSAIVKMYGKCGKLPDAQAVFDNIVDRDVIAWTNMIDAYVHRGLSRQAFKVYEAMQLQRIPPNKMTFISLLNACNAPELLEKGKLFHSQILREGLEADVKLATAIIKMYSSCRSIREARRVFRKLHQGNVLVWNAIIEAHVENLYNKECLNLFQNMQVEGVKPDNVTYATCFNACEKLEALGEGKRIHSSIEGSVFETDVLVGTSLLKFYSKCGNLEGLERTFDNMNQQKMASWNAMLFSYAEAGYCKETIKRFRQMMLEGAPPDIVTFVTVVEALQTLEEGKLIHKCITESGLEADIDVGNALLEMSGKFRALKLAHRMFEAMPEVDLASWTGIIAAYAQSGYNKEAVQLFQDMQLDGIKPDRTSFVTILNAVANLESPSDGERIHASIVERGLGSDVEVGTALIHMYAKCSSLEEAQEVFDNIHPRTVGCWNAMITAYAQQGHHQETLEIFQEIQVMPDNVTFATVIDAVTSLGDLEQGKEIHGRISDSKLEWDALVADALLNMYSKLGDSENARRVFDGMMERGVYSWNTIISAYARQSRGTKALRLFNQMIQEGVNPDSTSFTIILSACDRYSDLVDEGCHYFASMRSDHLMIPTKQHLSCLVNLLKKKGEAVSHEQGRIPC